MNSSSILSNDFSEERWVDQISKNFDDDVGNDTNDYVPVCVFSVPKTISQSKPEAYVPQAIALGPYHHFETRLYQMERYKVAAIKSILTQDQVLSFESLVINTLKEKETMIRASYHKYMNLDQDTLAWIVAVDGLFLLCLLGHYVDIVTLMPKKLINDGVLYRDVMVLENQIPLSLLSVLLKALRLSSNFCDQDDDYELFFMMKNFCEVHSPLTIAKDFNYGVETGYLHLLDLMYHLIVNNRDMEKEDRFNENLEMETEMRLHLGVIRKRKRDHDYNKVVTNNPWEKISNLLGQKITIQEKQNYEDPDPPSVTKTKFASVSSLTKYGQVNFVKTNGGIMDVKFDANKASLYLPIITLNDYSEIVLRNLIAYETATSRSKPELAEYIELMSSLVDTEADSKLLRAKGIIKGNMSDKEISDLFNGMKKSNVYLGKNVTIEQLNKYYYNRPMIKLWRFIKKDLSLSKKVATVGLTILICFLTILYSFCQVYDCQRSSDRK
ncbi:putative UPF0481 protein At3g02645 [Rutidosis leptorrhynchoides]|uniref:putative UPF0481 protein At3g02645 n=1 Tax=Rutidosis leptorrhynchoides TaxID=125765 RepID=UPI003A99EF74